MDEPLLPPKDSAGDKIRNYASISKPKPNELDNEIGGFEITQAQVNIPGSSTNRGKFSFRKLWAFTGPGFLMSIAYLDPGNIESDLQSGAIARYKLLWVLMWSTVIGLMMQYLAAKLGCVTGMNLAEVCRREYPKSSKVTVWLMIEAAIICSDTQEVIGSAIAINLLSNGVVPIWAGVLITGVDTFTFLLMENYGLRKLEAFVGFLITLMALSFMYIYIRITPDQGDILIGIWFPWCQDCNKDAILQLVAIIGAVIMPHNIYLHSALVLSRKIDRRDKEAVREATMYNGIESAIALFLSFLINLFVVAVFAAAFYGPEYSDAGLSLAGTWLHEKYGLSMKITWGIGLLAAGQSSTMTGTYAGQIVMEGFMNIRWTRWKRVLLTRSIAIIPTIVVAFLATNDLDSMNNWLNVLQSVQLPFALLPILHFTNSSRIMGEFKNGRILKITVCALVMLVIGVNFYLVALFMGTEQRWYVYLVTALVLLVYMSFISYLALGPSNVLAVKLKLFRVLKKDITKVEEEISRRNGLQYPVLQPDLTAP
ncbi:hypothetical protein ACJMK2_022101 [Sinanodonta woodiana]|uniref:Uncharacterized protein n=1 Tax=Sinanodonta woodiana TaxID=1069815 RepID=A0ABD3THZ9_SINWO